MDFIIIIFFIILITSLKKTNGDSDFLSHAQTNSIKGIAAFWVLVHHITFRGFAVDPPAFGVAFCMVGKGVSFAVGLFFFISGFGFARNYSKKTGEYKKLYLRKRLICTGIPFAMAIILFAFVKVLRHEFSFYNIVTEFFTEKTIVPYSWYIVAIMFFYFIFWIVMIIDSIFSNDYLIYVILSVVIIIYILFCFKFLELYWIRSVSCLLMGVLIGNVRETMRKRMVVVTAYFILLAVIVACLNDTIMWSVYIENLICVIAIVLLLFFLGYFTINSAVIDFLGDISLEIYLIQGLFTFGLRSSMIMINNGHIYAIAVIVLTLISAYCFAKIDRVIIKRVLAICNKQ